MSNLTQKIIEGDDDWVREDFSNENNERFVKDEYGFWWRYEVSHWRSIGPGVPPGYTGISGNQESKE